MSERTTQGQWGLAPYMRAMKLTAQQRDEIQQRYDEGESVRDLAAVFKVSAGTIRNFLRAHR